MHTHTDHMLIRFFDLHDVLGIGDYRISGKCHCNKITSTIPVILCIGLEIKDPYTVILCDNDSLAIIKGSSV